jgi:hypothetical protein
MRPRLNQTLRRFQQSLLTSPARSYNLPCSSSTLLELFKGNKFPYRHFTTWRYGNSWDKCEHIGTCR